MAWAYLFKYFICSEMGKNTALDIQNKLEHTEEHGFPYTWNADTLG